MNKNIILRIFLLLLLAIGSTACAEVVSNSTTTLNYVIPGGSALGLHDSAASPTIFLNDLKGQPVIGVSADTASGITGYWGWGYMWPTTPATPSGVPEGTVPLSISKEWFSSGTNVILIWEASVYPSIQLYMLTGDGTGKFTDDPAGWVRVDNPTLGFKFYQGQIVHFGGELPAVADGNNNYGAVYYKALQANYASRANYGDYLRTAWAVGKIDYTFGLGNTFFAVPLATSGTINDIFGSSSSQFASGSRIFAQSADRTGADAADYTGSWSNTITIRPEKGYYFYNRASAPVTTTLVGSVLTSALEESFGSGNNLFGFQFPISYNDLLMLSPGAAPGDRILLQSQDRTGFEQITSAEFENPVVNNLPYRAYGMMGYYYYRSTSPELWWTPAKP